MTETNWQIMGDYFEACNCQSTCPCIFLADPSEGDCRAALAWHIQDGHYGSVQLGGLNVVGIFHTPGNMASGPKWRAALYLDERAAPDQSDALRAIYSGQAGGFWANLAPLVGEQLGIRHVPILFETSGKQRRLRVPGTLELEIEGVVGGDPNQEARVTNPALYGAPGFDPVIARSTHYRYHDHDIEWDNSGKNAFYSSFKYAG